MHLLDTTILCQIIIGTPSQAERLRDPQQKRLMQQALDEIMDQFTWGVTDYGKTLDGFVEALNNIDIMIWIDGGAHGTANLLQQIAPHSGSGSGGGSDWRTETVCACCAIILPAPRQR